jgi:hypothetical protein
VINQILQSANQELLDDATSLMAAVEKARVFPELRPYQVWLAERLADIQNDADDNLQVLSLGYPELIPEILSRTQQLTRAMNLCNSRLAGPLLRIRESDRLSLRVLSWIHGKHERTRDTPFAVSDGEFASWPWPPNPALYFIPPTGQGGLRYQSLFFHEFGHLLYATESTALDAVVGAFQRSVEGFLEPRFVRNDMRSDAETRERRIIVETWYAWTQEFFCDGVGLRIGGPGFVYAFSAHLRLRGRGAFEPPHEKLPHSSHPPAGIRVRLLCHRLGQLGLSHLAEKMGTEWDAIAEALDAKPDYFGYYSEEFLDSLTTTTDHMLSIVDPYRFASEDMGRDELPVERWTPVYLVNRAWHLYYEDYKRYREWEPVAINRFLEQQG